MTKNIMAKPTPKLFDPGEVLALAAAVVKADRFPYLATIDGDQPRLRPVSPVRTEGFTVYVANLRSYHKTGEIAADVKLMWGCMDESRISIAAALHTAYACPATRYLDLDGSFDLSRDLASGGFVLRDGILHVPDAPGLGVRLDG